MKVLVLSLVFWISTWAIAPSSWAAIQVKLSDISYESCPSELAKDLVLGGGVMSANCYLVNGKATNPSGKVVYNADVFGRVYDANGNDIMPERTRLGAIPEVPTGDSAFQIMISVPAEQPEPLTFKQLKASGFSSQIRR